MHHRFWRLLMVGFLCLGGCGDDAPGDGKDAATGVDSQTPNPDAGADAAVIADAGSDAGADAGPPRPVWQVCDQAPIPTLPTQDWEHPLITGTTVLGSPDHSAQDVITVPARAVDIVGKFAYGLVSKDLEDEWIEVWLDDCSGALVWLGDQLTNSDGRIALPLAAADLPPVGAYATYLRVKGDNSYTRSVLRVVLPATQAMVMDIDGTLTTDDLELFQDIFADLFAPLGAGDYVPDARAGAIALTHRRRTEQGYLIIYMTGRPYYLTDITRSWLVDMAAAPGHLHVTDSNGEALPTESGVGTYKADYLAHLQGLGITLWAAYGNASTDIYAYEQVAIDKGRTFIVGSNGGDSGTVDLGDDYQTHLLDIANESPVVQPFDW